ncbi:MAG: phytanoyl-CoA dioxygenase family protein [Aliidongia sp.]
MTCWWAFAGRSEAKGFQRFHRDFDTPRFIKIFLYLTDVDLRSGAHVFVPGSQRSDKLRLTRYIDNDEVEAEFGQDAMVAMCGPAGTCFLEDTYGIHRAGLPVDRPRLILSAQYNIWRSPYAPKAPPRARRIRPLIGGSIGLISPDSRSNLI